MALSQQKIAWLIAGGVVVLAATAVKGAGLKKLGDELVVDTDTTAQVRNSQLIISSRPTLKNPTAESMVLFHPFVRIQFEKSASQPFASSTVRPTRYELRPNDQLSLDPIVISIGLSSLFRVIPKLIGQIQEDKAITIYVRYIVNLTENAIPFTQEEVYRFPVNSLDELLQLAAT